MKVTLLQTTPTGEALANKAASVCVGRLDNPSDKGLEHAVKSGHLSILEHLSITFLIEDVSRSLTHQLVRHRISSYSQKSQRYTKVNTNEEWYVIPESISHNIYAMSKYVSCMREISKTYNELLDLNIKKEDARYILPNASYTDIIVTMNARAFIEQCEKRLCNRAQWEIREMYKNMRNLIKDVYPTVYELAKPLCAKDKCKELKPCGQPFTES